MTSAPGASRSLVSRLVTQIGQKGFRAAAISRDDAAHIAANRKFLESRAFKLSLRTGDDEWESNVVAAFHLLKKATRMAWTRLCWRTSAALVESLPGFEASAWQGIVAPKATPVEINHRLNREINVGHATMRMCATWMSG